MAKGTCSVKECPDPAYCRGWCGKHYQKWVKYGDPLADRRPTPRVCKIEGCGKPHLCRGWCVRHYQSWLKHGDPLTTTREPLKSKTCGVEACGRQANEPGGARGWCRKHYMRWKAHGDPEASASCTGCGRRIVIGEKSAYCMRRECRRLFRAAQRAKDPERYRAMQATSRKRADKAKQRAAQRRYRARTDRECRYLGCKEFAHPPSGYCREHLREHHSQRYARKRLKIPRMLYIRQVGLCPDAAHGGCGLPLGDPDGNHVDHLIPEARNGPQEGWNLQLMHPDCNMRKSDYLVPAARLAAKEHGVVIPPRGGSRPRAKAAA